MYVSIFAYISKYLISYRFIYCIFACCMYHIKTTINISFETNAKKIVVALYVFNVVNTNWKSLRHPNVL